jgi:hypothetical protein
MSHVLISRKQFLQDRQGRTFADVLNDPEQPFDQVLAFFSDQDRQRRMEESELHHNRPPLAGVVRELESQPGIDQFLASNDPRRTKRLRQAVGVVVRMVMELRGWRGTGKKGSLGVRVAGDPPSTEAGVHNTGGLAFWFLRAERYQRPDGMPFRSVRERCHEIESVPSKESTAI